MKIKKIKINNKIKKYFFLHKKVFNFNNRTKKNKKYNIIVNHSTL